MKQKIVFIAFMFSIVLNVHLRAEDKPKRQIPIVLQDDEIRAILVAEESYAYFGPEVTTLVDDLPIIHGYVSEQSQEHLDAVCALIAAGKTTAPARVLKAALEEAASCLNSMYDVSKDDAEKLAASIETYYQQLEDGKVELIVDDATGQDILGKAFVNKFFNGNITVAGNAIIKGNENVYGNLTVNSDETVLGNLSVGQNETIGGNLTVNGQIIANNSAITVCDVILPAATPGATVNVTNCGFIELGGASPSTSNVDIYEVTGRGQGRNLFAGNYTTVPAALTTAADNIAIGTNALTSIATGTSNIAIGVNAANMTVAAQNGVAIGTNATMSSDSVVIGHAATSTGAQRSIVIGSIDSTNAVGTAPTSGAVNAIAIGSASGTFNGASATGSGAIAIGGSDATEGASGAFATSESSVAIGTGSVASNSFGIAIGSFANAQGAESVALGFSANALGSLSTALGTSSIVQAVASNSVAIGAANATHANTCIIGAAGSIGLGVLQVGIGTNAPSAKLHVTGVSTGVPVARFDAFDTTAGSQIFLSNVAAGAATNALSLTAATTGSLQVVGSSRRFKENFRPLGDLSSKIYSLNPCLFDYREENGGVKDYPGFVAEEVAEVLPTIVNYDEEGKPFSNRDNCFHALAIKELQKHQQRLDEQNGIINALLQRIELLESK